MMDGSNDGSDCDSPSFLVVAHRLWHPDACPVRVTICGRSDVYSSEIVEPAATSPTDGKRENDKWAN